MWLVLASNLHIFTIRNHSVTFKQLLPAKKSLKQRSPTYGQISIFSAHCTDWYALIINLNMALAWPAVLSSQWLCTLHATLLLKKITQGATYFYHVAKYNVWYDAMLQWTKACSRTYESLVPIRKGEFTMMIIMWITFNHNVVSFPPFIIHETLYKGNGG